jgi:UPF0716 protein FxsA
MAWILFLLFIALPIAEIGVLIQAGGWLGLWPTIGLVILTAAAGAALARAEGRASMRRLSDVIEAGGTPVGPMMDAAGIFVGAILLLTPGFITDAFGLSLLFRPTRLLWGKFFIWIQGGRDKAAAGYSDPDDPMIIEGDFEETETRRRQDEPKPPAP